MSVPARKVIATLLLLLPQILNVKISTNAKLGITIAINCRPNV